MRSSLVPYKKTAFWAVAYLVLLVWCTLHWAYAVHRYPEGSWVPVVFIPFYALGSLVAAVVLAGLVRWISGEEGSFVSVFNATFIISFAILNLVTILSSF